MENLNKHLKYIFETTIYHLNPIVTTSPEADMAVDLHIRAFHNLKALYVHTFHARRAKNKPDNPLNLPY
ncbi:MAG: hypothetical protein BGO21_12080 [Dyadobacter sp. 50-39]|nr:MAG: hypothetical protein BGO21_12080 [Dyadobacter sp. 50-39]